MAWFQSMVIDIVTSFSEKSIKNPYINSGIYIFDPSIFSNCQKGFL